MIRRSSGGALLLLLLIAGSARADEPGVLEQRVLERAAAHPVALEVQLGFSEKTPGSGFVPVTVNLTSRRGGRGVVVLVRSLESGGTPILRIGPVELEERVPRRLTGIAPAKLLNEANILHLTCETKDGVVVGEALAYPEPSFDRFLLILDHHSGGPADLSKLKSPQKAVRRGGDRHWITTVVSSLDRLPHNALAYTGITTVILGDLELERWSATQAQALAGWLARGGNLIVSVGNRGSLLRKSLLGRRLGSALAPIPFDRPPVPGSAVSLDKVLANFGPMEEIKTTRPPYLAVLNPAQGDAVLLRTDQGLPFAIQRKHGLGSIVLVACDLWSPPFLHAPHTTGLLGSLVDGTARYRPRSRYLFHELAGIQQPAQIGAAFALLIMYALVAGPLIYFILRAKRRGILLWIAIPALTVGFTMLVPFYRLALKDGESTVVGVRLVEVRSGSSLGVETIDALLFSGSLDKKRITLSGEDAAAFAVIPPRSLSRQGRRRAPDLGPVLGHATSDGKLSFDLPVALWGARYLSFERTSRVKPTRGLVEVGMKDRRGKVSVRVRYDGVYPLRDAVVLYPHRISPLVHEIEHDLSPGTEYRATLPHGTPIASYSAKGSDLGSLVVQRLLLAPYKWRAERDRKAYLIGHTNDPSPIRAEPNVRSRAFATVVVVELPIRYADGVPFGVAQVRRESSTVAALNTTTLTRRIKTELSLPPGVRRDRVHRVSLQLKAARGSVLTGNALRLRGLSHAGKAPTWKPIQLEADGLHRARSGLLISFPLPAPARQWISPDGKLSFIQLFDRPRIEPDQAYSARLDVSVEWGKPGAGGPPPKGP